MKEAVEIGLTVFAASPPDDVALEAAKDYINHHGLTQTEVKITRNDKVISVIAKTEFTLKETPWTLIKN